MTASRSYAHTFKAAADAALLPFSSAPAAAELRNMQNFIALLLNAPICVLNNMAQINYFFCNCRVKICFINIKIA